LCSFEGCTISCIACAASLSLGRWATKVGSGPADESNLESEGRREAQVISKLTRRIVAPARWAGLRMRGNVAAVAAVVALALVGLGMAQAATQRPTPTHLQIVPRVEALAVSWGVSSTAQLSGFRVRWRTEATRRWAPPMTLTASKRSYVIKDLSIEPYEVEVRALYVRTIKSVKAHGNGNKLAASASSASKLGGASVGTGTPLPKGKQSEPPSEEEPPGKEEPPRKEEPPGKEEPPREEEPPGQEEPPVEKESPGQGCELYASANGSDSNSGMQSSPLRTVGRLLQKLKAGQTGCLASGTYGGVSVNSGESHGREGAPVTITSTEPSNPATVSGSVSLFDGADWIVFTHLIFDWNMPKPWMCWTAEGNHTTDKIITFPLDGKCEGGKQNSEDAVQIGVDGAHDSFTWDEVTNNDTDICFNVTNHGGEFATDTLIEHDRIHNCGPPVLPVSEGGFPAVNEEPGWHDHGVYDFGRGTLVKNSYIYDNSRDGVLFNPNGENAVVEHDVIDGNGAGVWFGSSKNSIARWNIITNSTSPRGTDDYGIGSYEPGSGGVAEHNCLYGNKSGEIEREIGVKLVENKTGANPLYVDAANHEYALQAGSPCAGYGPE
jgi:hypothetical protein